MERKGFDWGRGPLTNKVWIEPRSLAGSAPRPCGHEDLDRNLRPQVGGRELRLSRSAFASSSRQGATVERACAAACTQAKFGCSESVICAYRLTCQEPNEQSNRVQGGSEPGRRGTRRATTVDQVHAPAVVGECANSGQRGRFAYTCGPHGVPQEYARCGVTERSYGVHQ